MHRVCAACRKSGSPCKVIRTTEHIQTGTLMSESILATYEQLVLHLLAVVLQLPAQGLCSMPTSQVQAAWHV
jgi:hypothetical protein